jgi:hypothetical protein
MSEIDTDARCDPWHSERQHVGRGTHCEALAELVAKLSAQISMH